MVGIKAVMSSTDSKRPRGGVKTATLEVKYSVRLVKCAYKAVLKKEKSMSNKILANK